MKMNPAFEDIAKDLESVQFTVRVGYGQSWQAAQILQDVAERVGVKYIGGSAEAGQSFYKCNGSKVGMFRKACADVGFIATIQ